MENHHAKPQEERDTGEAILDALNKQMTLERSKGLTSMLVVIGSVLYAKKSTFSTKCLWRYPITKRMLTVDSVNGASPPVLWMLCRWRANQRGSSVEFVPYKPVSHTVKQRL